MIKNYFNIALRNFNRNKFFNILNVTGLSLGLTAFILISLYVINEISYDEYHQKKERIYRAKISLDINGVIYNEASVPFPAAEAFKNEFTEVESAVRVYKNTEPVLLRYNEEVYKEENLFFADPSLFKIFSYNFVYGNPQTAFNDPASIVITYSTAKKYFGYSNPLNQLLIYDNNHVLKVSGVIEDIPANSHFKFDFIIPLDFQLNLWKKETGLEGREYKWFWTGAWTYLLLNQHDDADNITNGFPNFVKKYFPDRIKAGVTLGLQPLTDIHLFSDLDNEIEPNGSILYVYIFSAVAVFVLLIACVNFVNLTTARSSKRFKEVGVRKILGAKRFQLFIQIITETIFTVIISFVITFGMVELLLPFFNELTGLQLSMSLIGIGNWILFTLVLLFFVALFSGFYPAYFISQFNPVNSLKKLSRTGGSKDFLRKIIVTAQFSVSIALIIGTGIIINQLQFVKNKNLGFDKENIISIKARPELNKNFDSFRNELKTLSGIKNVSKTSNIPGEGYYAYRFVPEGTSLENPIILPMLTVDYDFFETLLINIKQGRKFSREFPSDYSDAFIINETAAGILGWEKDPLNKKLSLFAPGTEEIGKSGRVIGVVEDFNFESLHHEMKPVILTLGDFTEFYIIKVSPNNLSNTISFIEQTFKKFEPEWPVEYSFLNSNILKNYQSEEKLQKVINYLTSLAIVIACLGLFGLASFSFEMRTKEIGIRKVLGASIPNIILLFSGEFLKPIIIANLIAWPVAYFIMDGWLNDFAYKTDINIWIFVLSGLIALLIALVTVSFQAVKAGLSNTIKSLRYE